ncbi:hypothetical protein D9M72_119190 [compost metagenome]
MKILNLDQYAEVKRRVTLKGIKHDVEEVSVQDFVNNFAAAEKLEADHANGVPMGEGVNLSVRAIMASVPTLDEATIRALKMPQMAALLQFIRGELDPEVAKDAPGAAPSEGEEAPEGADAKKA